MKPPQIASEEYYGIKILRDGTWLYGGTPIHRMPLVKLFATVLKRDESGDYWLETPYEKGRIEVEDAPFIAVELRLDGQGQNQTLSFRTNIDDWVTAGAAHPLRITYAANGEPAPYIMVHRGLEARLGRAVYYELAELAMAQPPQDGYFGVWSGNIFYPVGPVAESHGV
ncbi:MAG: DUF1285 domain-containing protein [Micavibrio sp.]|nr:DUF1285 domain-containing protein [Micavibrio sp.]